MTLSKSSLRILLNMPKYCFFDNDIWLAQSTKSHFSLTWRFFDISHQFTYHEGSNLFLFQIRVMLEPKCQTIDKFSANHYVSNYPKGDTTKIEIETNRDSLG
jgi:hypothetical protein